MRIKHGSDAYIQSDHIQEKLSNSNLNTKFTNDNMLRAWRRFVRLMCVTWRSRSSDFPMATKRRETFTRCLFVCRAIWDNGSSPMTVMVKVSLVADGDCTVRAGRKYFYLRTHKWNFFIKRVGRKLFLLCSFASPTVMCITKVIWRCKVPKRVLAF